MLTSNFCTSGANDSENSLPPTFPTLTIKKITLVNEDFMKTPEARDKETESKYSSLTSIVLVLMLLNDFPLQNLAHRLSSQTSWRKK
jgi:hypothetical protein